MNNQLLKTAREKFGLFFREIRKEKKLTQQQVGENIGVSLQTINKIELGKYPYSVDLLLKLSHVLGFTINFATKHTSDLTRLKLEPIEGNKYTITDQENGIICTFEKGMFNKTQVFRFTKINENTKDDLITIMREFGDWLHANHPELI